MKNDIEKEIQRLKNMYAYENKYSGLVVSGIDEAGRGPLAGPVAAGCVVLANDRDILYLNDSKKLSEKKREDLFLEIKEKALAFGVGLVSENEIDKINILEATFMAMKLAFNECNKMYINKFGKAIDVVLVDGNKEIKDFNIKQECIVKGDANSLSIAAASIIAKVTRDHIMIDYDKIYPEYGFLEHKGYGTKKHMDKIREIGACPIHRKSFLSFLKKYE